MNISIVIPLYNKVKNIHRAMKSVITQMNSEMELIVIDDGSTDGSLRLAQSISRFHPELNIRVHSQTNQGVSAARNMGVRLASHEYIAFLDADDQYDKNFLSEVECLARKYPCASILATAYRFKNSRANHVRNAELVGLSSKFERQILTDYFYSAAKGDLPVTSSSCCIKKEKLLEVGGFPEGENMGEDQAVWSQIALNNIIAISTRICSNYFVHADNSLMDSSVPRMELPFSIRLQKLLDAGEIPNSLIGSVKLYISSHLLDLTRRNIESKNRYNAFKILTDPRCRLQLKRWVYWNLRLISSQCGLPH
jgi:glycosyltransferase involved in cell wall biosynthesis